MLHFKSSPLSAGHHRHSMGQAFGAPLHVSAIVLLGATPSAWMASTPQYAESRNKYSVSLLGYTSGVVSKYPRENRLPLKVK